MQKLLKILELSVYFILPAFIVQTPSAELKEHFSTPTSLQTVKVCLYINSYNCRNFTYFYMHIHSNFCQQVQPCKVELVPGYGVTLTLESSWPYPVAMALAETLPWIETSCPPASVSYNKILHLMCLLDYINMMA